MRLFPLLIATLTSLAVADPNDPVSVWGQWVDENEHAIVLKAGLEVQEKGFRVYKESVKVKAGPHKVLASKLPKGEIKPDPFSHKDKEIYPDKAEWTVSVKPTASTTVELALTYRACNDQLCHLPKTKLIKLTAADKTAKVAGTALPR